MSFEQGPEPDPAAPAHGDFDPDDLVTDVTDPDAPSLYTETEIATFVQ